MATTTTVPLPVETEAYDSSKRVERSPLIIEERKNSRNTYMKCSWERVLKWIKMNLLLILTIASVIVGIVVGIGVSEVDYPSYSTEKHLLVQLLSFPGELFLRMLKMLILPLIVFSLIAGLGSLEAKVAGSLGWKTVLYYMSTTMSAVVLGLILVVSIKPGDRNFPVGPCDNSTNRDQVDGLEILDSLLDLGRNMFPDNLFTATFQTYTSHEEHENVTDYKQCLELYNISMTEEYYSTVDNITGNVSLQSCEAIQWLVEELGLSCDNATREWHIVTSGSRDGINILGIIVFTIAFGIVLGQLGPEGRNLVRYIGVMNEAIMRLVHVVMWYSPIGIASIVAGKLAEVDDIWTVVEEIGVYFATVLLGLFIHGVIVLPLIYLVLTRSNPLKLVKAVLQALLTAFGTSSSSATLPVTIQNLEENFGIDPRVTRFMLPVGATINMDGTALYEAVAAVFIAQVQTASLTLAKVIVITITAVCASVGAAGVPQAGLFTLIIVITAANLDPKDIALILTVDWFLDRFRTTVNVLGDSFGAGIVYHYSKKQLASVPRVPTANSKIPPTSAEAHNRNDVNEKNLDASDAESSESSPLYKNPSSPKKEETDL